LDEQLLERKVQRNVKEKNLLLEKMYDTEGVNSDRILASLRHFRDRLRSCITDTFLLIHEQLKNGKQILIEGAQGTLLDIDFGTYPYVTSSNTTFGGVCTGLGISGRKVDRVVGVLKAYTTRVGNGPFPTELDDDFGATLREMGREYGATTGRPRRCGWFDGVVARYSILINNVNFLAITKLDVLDQVESIQICTGYQYKGKIHTVFPTNPVVQQGIKPVYETHPGWMEPISDIREYDDLPENTKLYLNRISELVGVPIGLVSVGAARKDTIWC
jgi:adenylosuccinate synthase